MSCACFHFGLHNHLVAKGDSREYVEVVKKLIANELMQTPNAKVSSIQLPISKELLL
jgi:hypothetical protein